MDNKPLRNSFPNNPPTTDDDVEQFCKHAMRGNVDGMVEMIMTHGQQIVHRRDNINACALTWAAFSGHDDAIVFLLSEGAKIDAPGTDDRAALSWAAENGRIQTLRLLLNEGADIHAPDINGKTARDWAEQRGHKEIVKELDSWQEKIEAEATRKRIAESIAASKARAAQDREALKRQGRGFNLRKPK
jgi:ankyrin repeat protein